MVKPQIKENCRFNGQNYGKIGLRGWRDYFENSRANGASPLEKIAHWRGPVRRTRANGRNLIFFNTPYRG